MKPSVELFNLIKSLTKSEKRYFKLTSTLQSGEKNYLRLFEAIENQKVYDEEEIKEKFKGETFIKHLPSEKNHLYGLILKSLRGFHSDKSAAAQLQEQLRNIELLFNKALYKECFKLIKKSKKLAYEFEKFYFLLDLIDWEKRLIEEEYLQGNFDKDLNELVEEEGVCVEKLRNLAEYQKIYSKINYVFRRGGYARTEQDQKIVDEVSNYHLIKGKNTAISTKAATACYFIKGLCAITERNLEDTYINFSKVIKIMEENPPIMKELPKRYLKALNNLSYYYIDIKDWENFDITIKKIRDLGDKLGAANIDIEINVFAYSYLAELVALEIKGEYEYAINHLIPKVEAGLKEYNEKIKKEWAILFYYNLATIYFGAEDYKTSLKYVNKILNEVEGKLRMDLFAFARILNLIIHYELGNFDLLEYTIKSTSRYVKKNNRNYAFESMFLKYMRKLIKAKSVIVKQDILRSLKSDILVLFKDQSYERVVMLYFDFIAWIDSKIERKPFVEVKRNKSTIEYF